MTIAQAALQLAIGISFGLLLFLLASGFTLTFGLAGFVNLAHGAVFMVSAYVATAFAGTGSFLVPVLAAAATGIALSLLVYGVTLVRWSKIAKDPLSQVLLTFGLLLVFTGANVPVGSLPEWMQAVSAVLPFTHGIEAARELADGASLDQVSGLLAAELAIGTVSGALGFAFIRGAEWLSRAHATLDRM